MQKKMNFVKIVLFWTVVAALYYIGIKYVLPALLPLMLAFVTVWAADRVANCICSKLPLRQNRLRVYLLVLLFLGGGLILYFAVRFGAPGMQKMFLSLPKLYTNTFLPLLQRADTFFDKLAARIAPSGSAELDLIDTVAARGLAMITDLGTGMAVYFGKALPKIFVHAAFYLVCCLLFAVDFDRVKKAPLLFLSAESRQTAFDMFDRVFHTLNGMLIASAQLTAILFCVLFVGFLLIGTYKPLVWAIVCALIDLLPVLGCGAVLIPMSALCFLQNNAVGGVCYLLLYGVCGALKSVLEPRLTGKQVGLHPALSLILAFFGMRLFGFWGILALPLTGVLVLSYLMP